MARKQVGGAPSDPHDAIRKMDLDGRVPMNISSGPTAPASPSVGDVWFDPSGSVEPEGGAASFTRVPDGHTLLAEQRWSQGASTVHDDFRQNTWNGGPTYTVSNGELLVGLAPSDDAGLFYMGLALPSWGTTVEFVVPADTDDLFFGIGLGHMQFAVQLAGVVDGKRILSSFPTYWNGLGADVELGFPGETQTITAAAGDRMAVRMEVTGQIARFKIWPVGDPEPGWLLTKDYSDPSFEVVYPPPPSEQAWLEFWNTGPSSTTYTLHVGDWTIYQPEQQLIDSRIKALACIRDAGGWLNMQHQGIYDLSDPFSDQDAATKKYVDSRVDERAKYWASPGTLTAGNDLNEIDTDGSLYSNWLLTGGAPPAHMPPNAAGGDMLLTEYRFDGGVTRIQTAVNILWQLDGDPDPGPVGQAWGRELFDGTWSVWHRLGLAVEDVDAALPADVLRRDVNGWLNMDGRGIFNTGAVSLNSGPVEPQDAATKAYVDGVVQTVASDLELVAAAVTPHYIKATFGGGGYTGSNTFARLPVNVENSSDWANWSTADHQWTVPVAGVYLINANIRVADNYPAGANVGIGVGTLAADDPTFEWHGVTTAMRHTFGYSRTQHFSAGDNVFLYGYFDGGSGAVEAAMLALTLVAADPA